MAEVTKALGLGFLEALESLDSFGRKYRHLLLEVGRLLLVDEDPLEMFCTLQEVVDYFFNFWMLGE